MEPEVQEKVQKSFDDAKAEVKYAINYLEETIDGLRIDFCGIGTEQCAEKLESVLYKCKKIKKNLDDVEIR